MNAAWQKVPEVMSAEAKRKLAEFNAQQSDWTAVCKKCGAVLKGTLADIKAHRCGT